MHFRSWWNHTATSSRCIATECRAPSTKRRTSYRKPSFGRGALGTASKVGHLSAIGSTTSPPTSALGTLASKSRSRRLLPQDAGPAAVRFEPPHGQAVSEISWLEPYPDAALPDVADGVPGPEARY